MKTMAVQVLTRAAPARPPVGDGGLMTAVSDVSVSSSAVAAVGRVLRSKEGAGEPAPAGAAEGTSPRSLWRFGVCADADTVPWCHGLCLCAGRFGRADGRPTPRQRPGPSRLPVQALQEETQDLEEVRRSAGMWAPPNGGENAERSRRSRCWFTIRDNRLVYRKNHKVSCC